MSAVHRLRLSQCAVDVSSDFCIAYIQFPIVKFIPVILSQPNKFDLFNLNSMQAEHSSWLTDTVQDSVRLINLSSCQSSSINCINCILNPGGFVSCLSIPNSVNPNYELPLKSDWCIFRSWAGAGVQCLGRFTQQNLGYSDADWANVDSVVSSVFTCQLVTDRRVWLASTQSLILDDNVSQTLDLIIFGTWCLI